MSSHFHICILPSERPHDTALVCIAALLPGVDLGDQCGAVWQAAVETLAAKNTDLDFSHIQPARVFRGVVKDDATQECFRRFDPEHFFEAFAKVGVEIIHDQMDTARLGVDRVEQILNEGHEVGLGLKDAEHFSKAYLMPSLEAGLIAKKIPDKPRSSKQRYRLTRKGRQFLEHQDMDVE